ncbi:MULTISPECIES: hypothetical protein [Methylobacterium]|jgi:hypothetical protein|uniref:Protein of unassigned function n=2 Tax=Methylobacterium TaxID=407 RepID=A0A089NS54_9HYPH|nr:MULTISPECIES: hypothetical protein [Methylobacterium]AIQ88688.1 protein of unassigned function [Methylobacterium oryzae CBMB20]AWV18693.1 hypothetical protein A3862_26790 [Methylobacterium sp. XJLW]MBA9062747.1 hypothetical protein [Methylobacterium fujisawaense]RUP15161.1 MAG: hypothetical protein EKK43_08410 [Methylobacterium sp.]WFS08700.1 hypothetical protein P9K36_05215 [Methylobacterium sp. 391_Methyba4]
MKIRLIAAGAAGAALLLMPLAAQAAPTPVETKVAEADPQVHGATVERDDDVTCSRARRRLWIEGEGWVVRRITTCR